MTHHHRDAPIGADVTAHEVEEIVRRVLARLDVGPPRAPHLLGDRSRGHADLPPELRGTYAGRWEEPTDDAVGVVSPVTGPDAGRCLGCRLPGACAWVCPATTRRVLQEGADRVGASLGAEATSLSVARRIDHTLLAANATRGAVDRLCDEALRYRFATVCVNGHWVPRVAERLAGSEVDVCAVVGFPLGATFPEVKAAEARQAVRDGAAEIDMVMQIGALKSRDHALVSRDIRAVVSAVGVPVKVILETALLTDEEKVEACVLAKAAGAAFVKTSTGFGPSGATVEDVRLMRRVVGGDVGVKASGGVRSADQAQAMIEAGATRIGASASIAILGGPNLT